ncbi:isoprenylcysteine carboxylmethyltransferase family protein [bacterium SCSIO 12696]|nr:isoprenylcysteine carboxylmethyltransferase family protein [bacterium SCSIO 12696]
MRALLMIYSISCYLAGVAALVFLILFVADYPVLITINHASVYAPQLPPLSAALWNTLLLLVWGIQHSVMADPGFKKRWTRCIPVAAERSTYVLTVAIVTVGVILLWCPMPQMLWKTGGSVLGYTLTGIYWAGWLVVLISTFLINHWHLFGLQQAYQQARQIPSKACTFVTPLFYKIVRHPMMTGVLIALWAAPDMSWGRLLFALVMTGYVYMGTKHEEKTLVMELGDRYTGYCKATPMLFPKLGKK